jgi:curved DNA-binding protein CbpA
MAHETLSDERSRAIYDARSSRSTDHPSNGRSPFGSDSEDDNTYYSDGEGDTYFQDFMYARARYSRYTRGFGGGAFFFDGFGIFFGTPPQMSPEEVRKEREQQEADETAWRKRRVDEVRQRKEAEEAPAKARAAAKAAEEKARASAMEQLEKAERAKQEALWAQAQATTQADKQDTCLHSASWVKEKHVKKIKCTSCGQKRGLVSHRCPHCSLVVCQVCLNELRNV